MAGDIIFFSLASSGRLHGGPYFDFLRDFFYILLARINSEAAMGGAGVGGGAGAGYVIFLGAE